MKWFVRVSDRIHRHRARQQSSAGPEAKPEAAPPAPAHPLEETHPAALGIHPITQTDNSHLQSGGTVAQSESVWSAAYDKALSLLDEEIRDAVSKSQDMEELFDNLNETNTKQKKESILRRGIGKLEIPIKVVNSAVAVSSSVASFHPTASAAFSIAQSVTKLALCVCAMEARLTNHITDMLGQIKIIDECDTLGQKFDDRELIHEALVTVYKDLLLFYYAVVHVLNKKSVALAWISEQFNERIPPVVQDFLKHVSLLHQHIDNATSKVIKSIESLLIDNKIQKILGRNKLDQLEAFHFGLTTKMATDACKWVLDNPTFCAWYGTASTGLHVLYGEMGCGKSTTMAFLIDHVTQLNRGLIPSAIICYHYCRDAETSKFLSVYSSLIQQLMHKKKQVKVQFNSWFEKHTSESNYAPTHDSKLLGDFFFDTIKSLERPVFIFLDGLDECEDNSCEELVTSLKHQSLVMPGLRCCVSVRYHEHVQTLLKGCAEIHIQKDPGRDAVIVSHMVKNQLSFLEGEMQTFVIRRLSELAKGSAIWAQMAVDLLATRKIHAPAKIRAFLTDELPQSRLSDLYAKLFSQVTKDDDDNAKCLSDALEILAIVERPLSIPELGWAVALRDSETGIETVDELKDYVDTKRLFGFLSPFISIVQFEEKSKRQVRLAHRSVQELVFQSPPRLWAQLRLSTQMPKAAVVERRSELHGKAAQECVKYLLLREIGDQGLFSSEQAWAQSLDELPGAHAFDDGASSTSTSNSTISAPTPDMDQGYYDPSERGFGGFFTYASCYWLHHLCRAERGNGPALSNVITLTTPGKIRSDNWWEQFYRPDCTRQHDESKARPEFLDPLTIVSLYGPAYLFEELLREVETPVEGGLSITARQRKNAVETILQQGDMSRLPSLIRFDAGADIEQAVHLSVAVMRHWSKKCEGLTADEKNNFDLVFDHIASAFDIMVEQAWGNEMLCLAAGHGCLPIIERLFRAASCNPALKQEILRAPHRDNGKSLEVVLHQSVGDAAWNGQAATVAFLLEQEGIESHLRYRDRRGSNVLHKATRNAKDPEMLKMLLSRYPEGISEKDCGGDMPLQILVFRRRPNGAELVKLFLEAGADVRCGFGVGPSDWHEPLRMATRYGDLDVIETLVRVGGADPMSVFKPSQYQDGELDLIDPSYNELLRQQVRETLLSLHEDRLSGSL